MGTRRNVSFAMHAEPPKENTSKRICSSKISLGINVGRETPLFCTVFRAPVFHWNGGSDQSVDSQKTRSKQNFAKQMHFALKSNSLHRFWHEQRTFTCSLRRLKLDIAFSKAATTDKRSKGHVNFVWIRWHRMLRGQKVYKFTEISDRDHNEA